SQVSSSPGFKETDFHLSWPVRGEAEIALPPQIAAPQPVKEALKYPGLLPARLPRPFGLSLLSGSLANRYEPQNTGQSATNHKSIPGRKDSTTDNRKASFPVRVALFDTPEPAKIAHHFGVACLLCSQLHLPPARISTRWSAHLALNIAALPYEKAVLLTDLELLATLSSLEKAKVDTWLVRDASALSQLARDFRDRFEDEVYALSKELAKIGEIYREVGSSLSKHFPLSAIEDVTQVRTQLSKLIYPGFIWDLNQYFDDLGRYLQAVLNRLQKTHQGQSAGNHLEQQVLAIWEDARDKLEKSAATGVNFSQVAALLRARGLLEELRVSIFAQSLGTREKVSLKRLTKLLKDSRH
ncbi:MAG: DUF3418 domain-containing protein, partial [Varibaculum timonense]